MDSRRLPWEPVYREEIRVGDKTERIEALVDCQCHECPVSYITPESEELLRIFGHARIAGESCGASLFGPDFSRWPARMYDALVEIEAARLEARTAMQEAMDLAHERKR